MVEQWIKDDQKPFSYRFAILEKNSFEVIGMINIVEIDYQSETMEMKHCLKIHMRKKAMLLFYKNIG
jgi:hypothetical protein